MTSAHALWGSYNKFVLSTLPQRADKYSAVRHIDRVSVSLPGGWGYRGCYTGYAPYNELFETWKLKSVTERKHCSGANPI